MDISNPVAAGVAVMAIGAILILSQIISDVKFQNAAVTLQSSNPVRFGIVVGIGTLVVGMGFFLLVSGGAGRAEGQVPSAVPTAVPVPVNTVAPPTPPPIAQPTACPEKAAQPVRPGVPPPLDPASGLDLDCGRVIPADAPGVDISGSVAGTIDARSPARVARVDDIGATQFDRCAALPEADWKASLAGLAELSPQGGLCVRTGAGNLAIVKFDSPFTGPGLDIRYNISYRS